MKKVHIRDLFCTAKVASAALVILGLASTEVLGATVTINNCDGSFLTSQNLADGESASVRITAPSLSGSQATVRLSSSELSLPALQADVHNDAISVFSKVSAGSWNACVAESGSILTAEILQRDQKTTVALLGSGALAIGSLALLANSDTNDSSGINGQSGSDALVVTPPLSGTSSSPTREAATARPVETVSKNPDCRGIKTLAATSGCRNTEDTDPLSPFR